MSTSNTTPQPKFVVGQAVNAISFTSSGGKFIPATLGLVVSEVRLVKPANPRDTMKPYYRVKADVSGLGYVEGAERFFEPAEAL